MLLSMVCLFLRFISISQSSSFGFDKVCFRVGHPFELAFNLDELEPENRTNFRYFGSAWGEHGRFARFKYDKAIDCSHTFLGCSLRKLETKVSELRHS